MKDNTITLLMAEAGCIVLGAICAIMREWVYVGMVITGMIGMLGGHLNGTSTPTETQAVVIKELETLKKRMDKSEEE